MFVISRTRSILIAAGRMNLLVIFLPYEYGAYKKTCRGRSFAL